MRYLLETYENFTLSNPVITLKLIVWSVFAGIIIAAFASIYNKRIIGSVVRALIAKQATGSEAAITLADAGCAKNPFVKLSLRHDSGVLRKFVKCVEDEAVAADADGKLDPRKKLTFAEWIRNFFTGDPYPPRKTDTAKSHFYIPADLCDRALIRYEKKGTDWFTFALTAVVFLALAFLAIKYVPQLISMVDGMITNFKEI